MAYDYKQIYEKSAAFYNAHPKAKEALKIANAVLTFGFVFAYAALWIYGLFNEFSPKDFAKIFALPVGALLLVSVLRMAIDKPRPYHKDGAGITPLVPRDEREQGSFPSRHLACAFVISAIFLPYLPLAGCIGMLLGCALGYARFALGLHYPSDLITGGILGLAIGCLIFVF